MLPLPSLHLLMTLSGSLFSMVLVLAPPRLEPPLQDGDILTEPNKRNEMEASNLVHQTVNKWYSYFTSCSLVWAGTSI